LYVVSGQYFFFWYILLRLKNLVPIIRPRVAP
jgi:hypothetical protein